MSSVSIVIPISAPQPDQHDAGIGADAPHRSDTQTHNNEPCEYVGLTIPHSVSPYKPAHGGNNADNTSLVPSSSASPILSLTSSPPVFVAGEASLFDTAHEIPLPPSAANSVFREAHPVDTVHQIPLPPSVTSSVAEMSFPFDTAHDVPLPPSESIFEVGGAYVSDSPDPAHRIPLPPSAASSMDSIFPVNNPSMPQDSTGSESQDDYELKVKDLWNGSHRREAGSLQAHIGQISKWLPHLGVLFPETDMEAAASALVKMYQISETISTFKEIDEVRVGSQSTWDNVRDCLSRKPLTIGTERLVLVEDLSP